MLDRPRYVTELSISTADKSALLEKLRATVQCLCHAEDVRFDLNIPSWTVPPPAAPATPDVPTLGQTLQAYLAAHHGARGARFVDYTNDVGLDLVLGYLPLLVQGDVIGALAVAIPRGRWEDDNGPDLCRHISGLVAHLIGDCCTKLELELDLVALNRRVDYLIRKSETDALTQLENKASFEKKARAKLNAGVGASALVLLDIDHFKAVNDLFGHQFGDSYLQSIAQTMQRTFPEGTLIGRAGGDEFCALVDLPATGRRYLDSLVKRLRANLQRAVAILGKPELGRVSIGVGLHPVQATDYEGLFGAADAALYAAKRSGRNSTAVFNGEHVPFLNHRDFAERFSDALEDGRIVPYFQPIVSLGSGACAGYEVLARWHDASKGLLTPKAFEPVFHDHRMAEALTSQMISHALGRVSDLGGRSSGAQPELWINLTTYDLLNREFVFDIQNALTLNGLSWEQIVVEVTERVMLGERNGQVYRSLDEVRRRGGRVALDDFGTGFAGLLHVKDWPVDIIKIDRSFTSQVGTCERDQAVVRALLQIADTMKQSVVAEGIETDDQLMALKNMGCPFGQGFLFSEAMPSETLSEAPRDYPELMSGSA